MLWHRHNKNSNRIASLLNHFWIGGRLSNWTSMSLISLSSQKPARNLCPKSAPVFL